MQAMFELAVHEHRGGNLLRARQLYESILQTADSPQVRCNLATVLRTLGDGEQAERLYRQAIAIKPDLAEAHGGLGNVLRDAGRFDEAIDCLRIALDLKPDYTDAHVNLGNVLQGLGRYEEAAKHFEHALRHGPDDEETRFTLAAIRGERPSEAPASYARNLFDSYADRFDDHLVTALKYRVPELMRAALGAVLGEAGSPKSLRVADLGCGTGLCAAAVADLAATIQGVDLAPKMVEKAQARGIYDEVVCGDIVTFLKQRQGAFDLALAGDVFIYVGDMRPTLEAAHDALVSGGLFALSVEALDADGFALQPTARFAHSMAYIERTAQAAGFTVCWRDDITVRIDRGVALPGHLYVLQRR